jgi:DnaJ-domain-containing protein 1
LLYRLGRNDASGILTISPSAPLGSSVRPSTDGLAITATRSEVFVMRRGNVVASDGEAAKKTLVSRLVRLLGADEVHVVFEGGVTAYPPGATNQISLTAWARQHLEGQLDGTLAEALVRELAGVRLSLRPELAPTPVDEADRRMIAAMAVPRRLDQIWPLARTPRFRLLAFIHFLRSIDALEAGGVVVEKSAPHRVVDPRRMAALRTLGVDATADLETVKRAYRRLARELHPDLQPDVDAQRRRTLERRFAEVTAAYEALI